MKAKHLMVGVDTGGTFTDIVFREDGRLGRLKLLSTPRDPGAAVLEGLTQLFAERSPDLLTYGTTVATNAMLERRGAKTALVTTSGFEDVLAIGRQARPDLYALEPQTVPALVPSSLRFGVQERTLFDGSVLTKLRATETKELAKTLKRAKVESIAVCLLHASANPKHERALERALGGLGLPITISSELSPEPGEFERTSTVVANAFVRPKVERHIRDLERGSGAKRFRVMQSNGGAIGGSRAATEPVRTMLSGPAGGVAAAQALAQELGIRRLVTFDMGGTSTDVALVTEGIPRRAVTVIGGVPVRTPTIDIHTVGAGGGSIAELDEGESLKVGPKSAGADPGPACYGRGKEPTVTDANLVLGRLLADRFLGGAMQLDTARSQTALSHLAKTMKLEDPRDAAEGVARVVEGSMERAVRVITVERGEDPRSCSLAAFGGAAALHACALAEALGMQEVVIPSDPGLFSALGVLDGRVIRDAIVALQPERPQLPKLRAAARAPLAAIEAELKSEGFAASAVETEVWARLRYRGQTVFLEVPLATSGRNAGAGGQAKLEESFHDLHRTRFHTADPQRAIESVGLRLVARGLTKTDSTRTKQAPKTAAKSQGRARAAAHTKVRHEGCEHDTAIYERETLGEGATLRGPALIAEYSSTTWLPPLWRARVAPGGHILCHPISRKSR